MELKGSIRNRSYQSRQLDSGLTWWKLGIEVRGDGQDNVRKEERIKDEKDMENMRYDLMGYWSHERKENKHLEIIFSTVIKV